MNIHINVDEGRWVLSKYCVMTVLSTFSDFLFSYRQKVQKIVFTKIYASEALLKISQKPYLRQNICITKHSAEYDIIG